MQRPTTRCVRMFTRKKWLKCTFSRKTYTENAVNDFLCVCNIIKNDYESRTGCASNWRVFHESEGVF